jgi:hypothetical protein
MFLFTEYIFNSFITYLFIKFSFLFNQYQSTKPKE